MKTNRLIYSLALDAMFIVLYFVLAKITVSFGNIRITLASLPIVVSALIFSLGNTLFISALGEFLIQVFSYGFSPTLPLWLIAPLLRGLIISIVAMIYKRHSKNLDSLIIPYYLTTVFASIIVTACNTLVLYLDALIIGYPVSIVFIETLIRFGTGILTAVVVSFLAHPLSEALRKFPSRLDQRQKKNIADQEAEKKPEETK